jgi:hypothetical protein
MYLGKFNSVGGYIMDEDSRPRYASAETAQISFMNFKQLDYELTGFDHHQ